MVLEKQGFLGLKVQNPEIFNQLAELVKANNLIPYDGSYKPYKTYHLTTCKPGEYSKLKWSGLEVEKAKIVKTTIFSDKIVFVLDNKKHVTVAEGSNVRNVLLKNFRMFEDYVGKEVSFGKEEFIEKTSLKADTNSLQFNKQDVKDYIDFLGHKETDWLHAFKPSIDGEAQRGDLKSLFCEVGKGEEQLIKEIESLNGQGIVCLAVNERPKGQTKGDDIKEINVLVFDIDVKKKLKVGYVSTPEHHEHAIKKAHELKKHLEETGFNVGLIVDSGNGAQVYCKVALDLTKDRETILNKLTSLENELRPLIEDEIVELDCITKDINRRMKIPGTINKKDTKQVEDRVARIIYKGEANEGNNISAFNRLKVKEPLSNVDNPSPNLEETKDDDKSRSAKEFGIIIKLIKEGKNKEQVFQDMMLYSKWASSPPQYKELTYKKALKVVDTEQPKQEKPSPQHKVHLDVLTYEDLKKFKVNKNFIVESFILPGTVTMVYSPPAQFKSLISAGMSFAIANGREFLGMKTKKSGVLYLDGENSQGIMKERAEQIHKGFRLKRNKFPLFFLQGGLLMDSKKNINLPYLVEIEALIKKEKIKVIIFDTLHRFCLYDENSSDDLNKLYTQVFKPLADELKVAVVFLHHSTKNGGYRGSGDFLGMVDVSYRVERKYKTDEFKIINEKCRSGEIPEIAGEITFGEDYIRFNRLNEEVEEEKSLDKQKTVTQRVEELFEDGQKLKRQDIIFFLEEAKFDYGSKKAIDRALKFLVEKKKVLDKLGRGEYTLILR